MHTPPPAPSHNALSRPVDLAEVAVPLPLETTFLYRVPAHLLGRLTPGIRVLVPFGRRTLTAYLLRCDQQQTEQPLKDIIEPLDCEPLWTADELSFFRWIADYYLHPLGEVLKTALPGGINLQSRKTTEGSVVTGGKRIKTARFCRVSGQQPQTVLKGRTADLYAFVQQQQQMVAVAELRSRFGECSPNLRRLADLGLVTITTQEIYRDPFQGLTVAADQPRVLQGHQQQVVTQLHNAVATRQFSPFLLHGVTGSGKTEVYLQTIALVLDQGNNALVLVPEISLTPQLVQRFRARFSQPIAVLHSGLSDGERYDEWRRIRRQQVRIVIGARSAIFAPLERIGIIVVDEEHEASFKQGDGLRYNARDLALVRGKLLQAVVLLGSATPLITSYYAARQGRLGYLEMPQRVAGRALPEVGMVTCRMTAETPLSAELLTALSENLERGEQSLLFLNRRGFASWLSCPACGADLSCPNCSVALTYHRQRRISLCHYCDYRVPAPCTCPACGEPELKEMGVGTERIEHELAARFPTARIARMDSDTVSGRGGHARILDKVRQQQVDMLIGTQMIAKGHDFPGVTLVGVLQAEGSLYQPDFRAAERTFQILAQVIGRAGRGELAGKVLLQAAQPEHYSIACAAGHDYRQFYQQELGFREELGYPPFGHLAALRFSAVSEPALLAAAGKGSELLRTLKQQLGIRTEILGPAPAPIYRLRGRFRCQVLLKDRQRQPLRRLLTAWRQTYEPSATVRATIDIDPVELL